MTENFQPSEDIFDDVEGHGKRPPGLDAGDNDVEGHVGRIRF